MKADATIRCLRERLKDIAPYPAGCVGFDERTMNGTDFFPCADGLWKPIPGDDPEFPFGGVLVLGSDYYDAAWYEAEFKQDVEYRQYLEVTKTWIGLRKILVLAEVPLDRAF